MARPDNPRISVLIPALDEAGNLPALLADLQPWRAAGDEVIVCDGGSRDGTQELARAGSDRVISASPGRAWQMNAAAATARGRLLWFVHADSRVPSRLRTQLLDADAEDAAWGRFDVRLSCPRPIFRVIAAAMNARSRLSGIATGDQGIFVRDEAFRAVSGFPEQPLMEDVALSTRLRQRLGMPHCLAGPLWASSRRWEVHGIWRTVSLMWRLRYAYWRGADPSVLHARYYGSGGSVGEGKRCGGC